MSCCSRTQSCNKMVSPNVYKCKHDRYFWKKMDDSAVMRPKSSDIRNEVHMMKQASKAACEGGDWASIHQMKELIKYNKDYFQKILREKCDVKPNKFEFKVPTKTAKTTYNQDYNKRNPLGNCNNISLNSNTLSTWKMLQGPFDGHSTYMKEYGPKEATRDGKVINGRKDNLQEKDAPSFLNTQNKTEFLNWGGINFCPSMKPPYKTAALNMAFQGKSLYHSDFDKKRGGPAKMMRNLNSFPKNSDMMMIRDSAYMNDYKKNPGYPHEIKSRTTPHKNWNKACGKLDGSTEYQGKFVNFPKGEDWCICVERTVEEMQKLLLDLERREAQFQQ